MKIIYIHIGGEKTGTTSIQNFLHENSQNLISKSILYPCELGSAYFENSGHFPIAASLALPHSGIDFLSKSKQDTMHLAGQQLLNLISSSDEEKIIISSEHFSSRSRDRAKIEIFRDALFQIVDDIKIIYYIRNQADLAASSFSTAVLCGRSHPFDVKMISEDNLYFNHFLLSEFWASIFGRENIIIKEYNEERFKSVSILEDFCKIFGLNNIDGFNFNKKFNKSLDKVSLEAVRNINYFMPSFHENPDCYPENQKLSGDIIVPSLPKNSKTKFKLNINDRNYILNKFIRSNQCINEKYMNRSLSKSWFPLLDESDANQDDYENELLIQKFLIRDMSQMSFALALALQETQSALQETQSALQETQSALQETQSALQETQSALQETQSEIALIYRTKLWMMRKYVFGILLEIKMKFRKNLSKLPNQKV